MGVSVVIPVKNGAATLHRCLESICNQTKSPGEIIIINSSSSDDSKEISLKYNARVIDICENEFDHGLTRNLGVENCYGDLVYFTVQDAWIADNDMLEKMSQHFKDSEVMAVTGHQAVPHEKDKNPVRWYRRYSDHHVDVRQVTDAEAFKNLPQSAQQKLVAWDNVVAMYRKSALMELPFAQTEMAEDWIWSYQALLNGWKLLRDPSLVVYHYHHQSYSYSFNSTYTLNYHFYKFFKYKPHLPKLVMPMMQLSYHLLKNKKLSFVEKLYWIRHNGSARIGNYFSILDFLKRLKKEGENGVQKGYEKYCKTIPQGEQKK